MSRIAVGLLLMTLLSAGCQQQGTGDSEAQKKPVQALKVGVTPVGTCTYGLVWLFEGVRKEAQMMWVLAKAGTNEAQLIRQWQILTRACFQLFKDNASTVCKSRIDYHTEELEIRVADLKGICDPVLQSIQSPAQSPVTQKSKTTFDL